MSSPADTLTDSTTRVTLTVTRQKGDHAVAAVRGQMDRAGTAGLLGALTAALDCATSLTIDLAGVPRCDISAPRLLVELHHRAQAASRTLTVINANSQVRGMMEHAGAAHLLASSAVPDRDSRCQDCHALLLRVCSILTRVGFQVCGKELAGENTSRDCGPSGLTVRVETGKVVIQWETPEDLRIHADQSAQEPCPNIHRALHAAVIAVLREGGLETEDCPETHEIAVAPGRQCGAGDDGQRRLKRIQNHAAHAIGATATIGQAIGIVAAHDGLDLAHSRKTLEDIAEHTSLRLADVAETLVEWADSGAIPHPILDHLQWSLTTRGIPQGLDHPAHRTDSSIPGTGPARPAASTSSSNCTPPKFSTRSSPCSATASRSDASQIGSG
ncbi:lipid asymmetry maintenance protein MlaB [Streptomyces sp. NPDC059828]|uniref:STAS domain-containing protein n=1 Tax=Streptomyces sp. NPDC059828 TaxID=3346965 RepID=UPI0036671470